MTRSLLHANTGRLSGSLHGDWNLRASAAGAVFSPSLAHILPVVDVHSQVAADVVSAEFFVCTVN